MWVELVYIYIYVVMDNITCHTTQGTKIPAEDHPCTKASDQSTVI